MFADPLSPHTLHLMNPENHHVEEHVPLQPTGLKVHVTLQD